MPKIIPFSATYKYAICHNAAETS